jgi:formylglycine-generating enzyme
MATLTESDIMATTLGDYLKQYGAPLPSPEALRLFCAIAKIVGDMHDQFAVYGELKIENIILNGNEPPTVLDCGVPQSRLTARQLTPEQIAVEARDDIYQLGVILYRLATGQEPPKRRPTFNFSVDADLASDRLPVPDPRTVNPKVSESIALLVARATATDATKRAGKVAELLSLLDDVPDDAQLSRPTIDITPGAPRSDAVTPAAATPREDAKISLKKRALPVVSERTGFLVNEREVNQLPTPSQVADAPKSLVDGIAQAFADISGTGEKPTGVGFKAFLGFAAFAILAVISLAAYRVAEKLTMADPTAISSQSVGSDAPTPTRPGREKLAPVTAPADVSAELPPLVAIQGGVFAMGSDAGLPDETPVHQVTVSDFEIGKYEVTNAQYKAFCDATKRPYPKEPTFLDTSIREYVRTLPNHPVVHVSWDDANAYCIWLSERTGNLYRLPTEAEWEYVARESPIGWDSYNSGGAPHEVGTSPPNALGLYDLRGNVWEWCGDWYAPYESGSQINPKGVPRGTHKVLRGCSWYFSTVPCRPTSRFRFEPDLDYWFNGGFRVVRAKR